MIHLNLYKRADQTLASVTFLLLVMVAMLLLLLLPSSRAVWMYPVHEHDKSSKYSWLKQRSTCVYAYCILHINVSVYTNTCYHVRWLYAQRKTADRGKNCDKMIEMLFFHCCVSLVRSLIHLQQLLLHNALFGFHVIHVTTVCKYNYILKWQKSLWMHCNKETGNLWHRSTASDREEESKSHEQTHGIACRSFFHIGLTFS